MNYYYKFPNSITFGGVIILLHEIYNIHNGKGKINLIINCGNRFKKLLSINSYLNSNIKIFFKKNNSKNFISLNNIIKKKRSYSFSFIYKNFIKVKYINFKKNYILKAKKYLNRKKLKNFICIHLYKNKIAPAKIKEWKKFINFMSQKYQVILLNSDPYKKYLSKMQNVHYVPNNKQKIFLEPIIAMLSLGFFANASGFCTFLNFSNTKYLILKIPKYHKILFRGETKKNKLLFANNDQLILRKNQTFNILKKYAKIIIK